MCVLAPVKQTKAAVSKRLVLNKSESATLAVIGAMSAASVGASVRPIVLNQTGPP